MTDLVSVSGVTKQFKQNFRGTFRKVLHTRPTKASSRVYRRRRAPLTDTGLGRRRVRSPTSATVNASARSGNVRALWRRSAGRGPVAPVPSSRRRCVADTRSTAASTTISERTRCMIDDRTSRAGSDLRSVAVAALYCRVCRAIPTDYTAGHC